MDGLQVKFQKQLKKNLKIFRLLLALKSQKKIVRKQKFFFMRGQVL